MTMSAYDAIRIARRTLASSPRITFDNYSGRIVSKSPGDDEGVEIAAAYNTLAEMHGGFSGKDAISKPLAAYGVLAEDDFAIIRLRDQSVIGAGSPFTIIDMTLRDGRELDLLRALHALTEAVLKGQGMVQPLLDLKAAPARGPGQIL